MQLADWLASWLCRGRTHCPNSRRAKSHWRGTRHDPAAELLEPRTLPSSSPALIDVAPGAASSYPERFQDINGTLMFVAKDGANVSRLWKTDGTSAGTTLVPEIRAGIKGPTPGNFASLDGVQYFGAADSANGVELWKTDGTAGGTVRVTDINPGSAGSDISGLVNLNGTLYFSANDGIHGMELWKSDGTAAGTSLVKDLSPGTNLTLAASHGAPSGLTVFNGALYFSARTAAGGRELWTSDGTADGTVLIKDINPGTSNSDPRDFVELNGSLYFVAYEPTYGQELWKTDGTANGTTIAADICPGPIGSGVQPPAIFNGQLFFTADDGIHGREPWRTDGTTAGSVLLGDLFPGASSSDASGFVAHEGRLYFGAFEGIGNRPLWESDGTSSGTIALKNLAPELVNRQTNPLASFNGLLFFRAESLAQGVELCVLDAPPDAISISTMNSSVLEGNSGTTPFTFTFTRTGSTSGSATADYAVTGSGTNAADATDFGGSLPSGTVSFAEGERSKTVTLNVNGDTAFESDEGFLVTLSNVIGMGLGTSVATVSILNDDAAPSLSIAATNASRFEGNSGNTGFTFTVTRTGNTVGTSSVDFAVTGSSTNAANAGDFGGTLPTGAVNFAAGETTKTITVNVSGDTNVEPIDGFTVTLSNAAGASLGSASATGTIRNDDSSLSIAATSASNSEGNSGTTPFTFTVTRTGTLSGTASVDFAVTGSSTNGVDANDFGGTLPSGTINFAATETTKTLTIDVSGDTNVESDEGFTVTLSNPVGANLGTAASVGTVVNDDSSLSIGVTTLADVQQPEGNSGSTALTIVVTRLGKITGTANANYAVTGAGTHSADAADFGGSFPTGTISFTPGEITKTITINVSGDLIVEPDEDFDVRLSNSIGAALGPSIGQTGTILNDDGSRDELANVLLDALGNLRIRDFATGGRADRLTVSFDAASQEIVIRDPHNTLTASVGTVVDPHEIHVARAEITGNGLHVELNGQADQLDLSELPAGMLAVEVDGGDGNDTIIGHAGADLIQGGLGDDSVSGGDGNDTLLGLNGNDLLRGEAGHDVLRGQTNNDRLLGGEGNDTCDGGGGDDNLSGDVGNDSLIGSTGNDLVSGGDGRDKVFGGDGHDSLDGNSGNDQVNGGSGNDTLDGGAGNDFMEGQTGNDLVNGSGGNDILQGGLDDDTLIGLSGHDRLEGGEGDDLEKGGEGNDTLLGGSGNDNLSGSIGDDFEDGGEGTDTVAGGDGNDSLAGGAGNDYIHGDAGLDDLHGNDGDDSLHGGTGNDVISGDLGNDILVGGEDDDTLLGGADNDWLFGTAGADHLTGESGADTLAGGSGTGADAGDVLNAEADDKIQEDNPLTANWSDRP